MMHYIRCVNRVEAFGLAQAFAKRYSDRKPKYGSRGALVATDEHEFLFISNSSKPHENEIKSKDFVKKYFTSQNSQPV